jgi:signal peptidase II
LFSGIIGNLIDRIFNGYVLDFLNFYILGYDYPVFNMANIFIVLGVVLMIIDVVRGEIYAYNKRKRKC